MSEIVLGAEIYDPEELAKKVVNTLNYHIARNAQLSAKLHAMETGQFAEEERCRFNKLAHELENGFRVSDAELAAIKKWRADNNVKNYYYKFTPTSIGIIGEVVDCDSKKCFTFQELN